MDLKIVTYQLVTPTPRTPFPNPMLMALRVRFDEPIISKHSILPNLPKYRKNFLDASLLFKTPRSQFGEPTG
jgi:hypothetical protein